MENMDTDVRVYRVNKLSSLSVRIALGACWTETSSK